MAMAAQDMDNRPMPKRMRPNTPPGRPYSPFPRREGIRKKNARFEIPAERSLLNIDRLIASSTNDDELKELKQQKRLLRNRQAAYEIPSVSPLAFGRTGRFTGFGSMIHLLTTYTASTLDNARKSTRKSLKKRRRSGPNDYSRSRKKLPLSVCKLKVTITNELGGSMSTCKSSSRSRH